MLLFVVGSIVLRLVLFGDFRDYVKPSQGPLLLAAGVLLVGFGIAGLLQDAPHDEGQPAAPRHASLRTHGPLRVDPAMIEQARREDTQRRHDHHGTPGVAWLLVLPMLLVLVVPPPALGAYTAGRAGAPVPAPVARRVYPPLPVGGPVLLDVHDYAERAAWDKGQTLAGHVVTLTGFVSPKNADGWYLTRMVITCCAADSRSYLVDVLGSGLSPVPNSWQQVVGTYTPGEPSGNGGTTARITATSVTPVSQPQDPYELP
jgi:uncharacterized repeat protein (TIGR03943 family)